MDYLQRVKRFLAEAMEVEEGQIDPSSRLAALFKVSPLPDDPGDAGGLLDEMTLDSLDFMAFTLALDEGFSEELRESSTDLEAWKSFFDQATVQDLADVLARGGLPE